jgi:nitrous oxidase accessory protein NosD
VRNNIIRGGKVAIYMCRDTEVVSNKCCESSSQGIFCSLPSRQLQIKNNIIYRSVNAGISFKPQLEHGELIEPTTEIIVEGNQILSTPHIGIELNKCHGIEITRNSIRWCDKDGIYVLRSENANIHHNQIIRCLNGLRIDIESKNNLFKENSVHSIYPNLTNNGVKIEPDVFDNLVEGNIVSGKFNGPAIVLNDISNQSINNIVQLFHQHFNERIDLHLV